MDYFFNVTLELPFEWGASGVLDYVSSDELNLVPNDEFNGLDWVAIMCATYLMV